jgi:hypothetical protein
MSDSFVSAPSMLSTIAYPAHSERVCDSTSPAPQQARDLMRVTAADAAQLKASEQADGDANNTPVDAVERSHEGGSCRAEKRL